MKRLPAIGHILCVLCFLLPFVQVSCNNVKLASLSGIDLATGRYSVKPPSDVGFGRMSDQMPMGKAQAGQSGSIEWSILIALLCVVVAGVFAFLGSRTTALVSMAAGAVGTVALLYFRSRSPDTSQSAGLITIEYQMGYYLALFLLILATAAVFFFEFVAGKKQPAMARAPSPPVYAAGTAPQRPAGAAAFCPTCGKAAAAGAVFCDGCGKPMR